MQSDTHDKHVDDQRVGMAASSVPPSPDSRTIESVPADFRPAEEKRIEVPNSNIDPANDDPGHDVAAGSNFLGPIGHILTWVPPRCRYDPKDPPKFNLALNLLFALVSCERLRTSLTYILHNRG